MRTPPIGTRVQVVWTDANYERGQLDRREALQVETPTVCTFGYLLEASILRVVVASEVIHYETSDNYRTTTAIPRSMVQRIIPLGEV